MLHQLIMFLYIYNSHWIFLFFSFSTSFNIQIIYLFFLNPNQMACSNFFFYLEPKIELKVALNDLPNKKNGGALCLFIVYFCFNYFLSVHCIINKQTHLTVVFLSIYIWEFIGQKAKALSFLKLPVLWRFQQEIKQNKIKKP